MSSRGPGCTQPSRGVGGAAVETKPSAPPDGGAGHCPRNILGALCTGPFFRGRPRWVRAGLLLATLLCVPRVWEMAGRLEPAPCPRQRPC